MNVVGPEQVAEVMTTWLQSEIEESDRGRNAVLSDFELRKADFDKPFDDPTNLNALKVSGHYNRLRLWAPLYPEMVANDQASARLSFCSLMFISGRFRERCLLNASSLEEYMTLRHEQGPVSVNLLEIAKNEFRDAENDGKPLPEKIHALVDRTLATNTENLAMHKYVHQTPNEKQNSPFAGTSLTEVMDLTQTLWVGLAIAQIIVASAVRSDDFASVPFMNL